MDNKTKLALECLNNGILTALGYDVFKKDNIDDKKEYELLKEYLPHTLNALAESKLEKHTKFMDLVKEYNLEANETDNEDVEDRIFFSSCKGAVMAKSTWDIDNDFEGNDTDYTIFLDFMNDTIIDYSYVLEIEMEVYSSDEDDTLQEDEYSVVGLSIRVFDVTNDDIVMYPTKKVFKYLQLVNLIKSSR